MDSNYDTLTYMDLEYLFNSTIYLLNSELEYPEYVNTLTDFIDEQMMLASCNGTTVQSAYEKIESAFKIAKELLAIQNARIKEKSYSYKLNHFR